MLIAQARAQDIAMEVTEGTDSAAGAVSSAAPPDMMSAVGWNVGLIVVLVVMFYVLLIMPQQKRFKEHKAMLDALKKGDKVVTSGGLVGTVDKLSDDDEVVVDLGNNVKVTALRHTIQTKVEKKAK